ncbi:MAG: hypothetical protein KF678_02210 [Phycisphaeraceae bacterium]|nr:hypothetical protein [Phycisphaeraceae bacterium]
MTFASNVVGPQSLVRSGPLIIPAGSLTAGSSPNVFGFTVSFNEPYFYSGGNLLVELRHTGSDAGIQTVDALSTTTTGYLTDFAACWSPVSNGLSGGPVNFAIIEFESSLGAATGRCCRPDGSCVVTTATHCATIGGAYGGDGTDCSPNPCPQPPTGACCFVTTCSVLTQAQCLAGGGTYQGDSSACSSCPAVVSTNCNISTGPMTLSGVAAAAGTVWSECAKDKAEPGLANTVAGFTGTGGFRLADDFVVPPGGMHLAYVKVYAYHSSATPTLATGANLRILNGSPAGTPTVVFGDQTTNRMAHAAFTNIYRIFPTTVGVGSGSPCVNGAGTAPGTTRRLQEIYITVNQFLPAGTYWLDYSFTHASTLFVPPATRADAVGRACNPNNSNALQRSSAGVWGPLVDSGQGCLNGAVVNTANPANVQQDTYFELVGTLPGSGCYANCDGSTGSPLLTPNDFQCFLNKFAANDTYANCDGSTGSPLLTPNDFQCFLNKFAAGCT